jgi:hypothetical protein
MANAAKVFKSEIEVITPRIAEDWLKTMKGNRPQSDSTVYEYATSMQAGKWVVNGETIKFDKEGHLFDGQHRLLACMIAGKSFKTYVVRGIVDTRAFATVDVGKLRTHGDIFHLDGYTDYFVASGIAAIVYYYKHKLLTMRGIMNMSRAAQRRNPIVTNIKRVLEKKELTRFGRQVEKEVLLEFARPYREQILKSIRAIHDQKARKIMPKVVMAAAYLLFAEKDEFEAGQFMDRLTEGTGLLAGDPVHTLRERLLSNQFLREKRGAYMNRWTVLALTIKSWNKFRAHEKCSILRIAEDEKFPVVE